MCMLISTIHVSNKLLAKFEPNTLTRIGMARFIFMKFRQNIDLNAITKILKFEKKNEPLTLSEKNHWVKCSLTKNFFLL